MAIIVDEMIGGMMDEDLLSSPLSMVLNVILGLVTFGADDFLDFLNAFFIELGIMIFERTYLGPVVGAMTDWANETIPKAKETLQIWFTAEDDGLDEQEAAATAGGGKGGAGGEDESASDSNVYYSEEDSIHN